jgi:hypothetical protein
LPEANAVQHDPSHEPQAGSNAAAGRHYSSTSLHELWQVLARQRLLVMSVVGGLLLACLAYCLVAPNQFEASAKVALRTAPASVLSLEAACSWRPWPTSFAATNWPGA